MKQTLYIYLNSNSITEYIIINIYVKYSRLYQQHIHFSHLQQVQRKGKNPFNMSSKWSEMVIILSYI